jgi:hypothetical protein
MQWMEIFCLGNIHIRIGESITWSKNRCALGLLESNHIEPSFSQLVKTSSYRSAIIGILKIKVSCNFVWYFLNTGMITLTFIQLIINFLSQLSCSSPSLVGGRPQPVPLPCGAARNADRANERVGQTTNAATAWLSHRASLHAAFHNALIANMSIIAFEPVHLC